MKQLLIYLLLIVWLNGFWCSSLIGPDPWDYVKEDIPFDTQKDENVPPDLKIPSKKKTESSVGMGEWFFRRALAIAIKGGTSKVNEDGSVDVSLQMRFEADKWQTLNNYIKSNLPLSEDMFRRSLGYLEESIYKPSITEKIAVAWDEYVHQYLMDHKMHITWSLGIGAALGLLIWLWKIASHKHIIIIIFITFYLYEVFISYKEAEQKELDRFLTAVNKCSWYFWKTECEYPPPDPLILIKHMNPLKIAIRMFTTLISEPMISLNATVNAMIHGVTDGLWFPFDKIINGCLLLFINILLIFMLIMIIFNYLLNIPFNLSLLGLVSIGVKQRNRTLNLNTSNVQQLPENSNRISGATLDRLLEVCSRALESSNNKKLNTAINRNTSSPPKIKKSASTGRLHSLSLEENNMYGFDNIVRRRPNKMFMIGGGDSK